MPKETIEPQHRETTPGGQDGPIKGLPEIQLTWGREFPDVGVGIECPPGPAGERYHILDYLYGDELEKIGEALADQFRAAGWHLEHDASAVQGVSMLDAQRTLGRMALDAVIAASDGRVHTGIWTYLDRRGLNRLIQVSKKAGAVAFGRDEW